MFERKSIKRASSTIEVALAIVMALLVLYLVLNLFSGNIQTVVKNSGLYKVTHKDNADKKTANIAMDTDPTKTQINVQIVADQGSLAQYHNDAAATIERYETESHSGTLTDENIQNLALQTTIFAESDTTGQAPIKVLQNEHFGNDSTKPSYYDFTRNNYGIIVYEDPASKEVRYTSVARGNKKVNWGTGTPLGSNKQYNPDAKFSYPYQDPAGISNAQSNRVKNIEGIKKCFQEQYKL